MQQTDVDLFEIRIDSFWFDDGWDNLVIWFFASYVGDCVPPTLGSFSVLKEIKEN